MTTSVREGNLYIFSHLLVFLGTRYGHETSEILYNGVVFTNGEIVI